MRKFNSKNYIILVFLSLYAITFAQENNIEVFPSTQKYLGSTSKLDRTKFFNLHGGGKDEDVKKFLKDYNVTLGRGFWGPFSVAKQKTKKTGTYPNSKKANPGVKKVIQNISTEHPKIGFSVGMDFNKAGKWAAEYFKNFAGNTISEFYEPMNEPFVHAKDFLKGGWNTEEINSIKKEMASFYAACGKEIHKIPNTWMDLPHTYTMVLT